MHAVNLLLIAVKLPWLYGNLQARMTFFAALTGSSAIL